MAEYYTKVIQQQLERTKDRLENVDDTLRKLTGRDVNERRVGNDQRRVSVGAQGQRGGRSRDIGGNRTDPFQRLGAPPAKRPMLGSAFSRLGRIVKSPEASDDEDGSKPSIQSSVIATTATPIVRSREDTVTAQNKDTKGKARNKRMFGLLIGTLQKFKQEATESSEKTKGRIEIEKKLDERAAEERKKAAIERKELFNERRENMEKMAELEQLMELAKEQQEWDKHTRQLTRFIRTKAKPHIFYKPVKHTESTDKKLQETRDHFHGVIRKRKEELDQKLADISTAKDLKRQERPKVRSNIVMEAEARHIRDKENRKRRSSDGMGKAREGVRDRRLSETSRRRSSDVKRRSSESQRSSERRRNSEGGRERRSSGKSRRTSTSQNKDSKHHDETIPEEKKASNEGEQSEKDQTVKGEIKIKEEKPDEDRRPTTGEPMQEDDGQPKEDGEGKTGEHAGDVGSGIGVVIGGRVGDEGSGGQWETEGAQGGGNESQNTAWGNEGWDLNEIPLPQRERTTVEVKIEDVSGTDDKGESKNEPGSEFQMDGPDEQLDYNEVMD